MTDDSKPASGHVSNDMPPADAPGAEPPALFAEDPPRDWDEDEEKLWSRWQTLTDDDFAAVNGDRDRFVDRLASREAISREQAERDLVAYEARKTIGWRTGMPGARGNGPAAVHSTGPMYGSNYKPLYVETGVSLTAADA